MRQIALLAALAVLALLPAGASAAFGPLTSFGAFGSAAGQMDEPAGIDVAADGTVYVSDFQNNRIDVFSPRGEFRFAFGAGVNPAGGGLCTLATGCATAPKSEAARTVNGPDGLAIAANGDVYVGSERNNRIDVFSPKGEFRFAFGAGVSPDGTRICAASCKRGTGGVAAGTIDEPFGLALDAAGNVYATDAGQNRVNVFSPAGAFLYAFGKKVNPDLAAANRDVCTDLSGCRGGDNEGSGGSLARPFGISLTADGSLAIAERDSARVSVFTPAGQFRFAFGKGVNLLDGSDVCTVASGCKAGGAKAGPGELSTPGGLAVGASGQIYVSDGERSRISEFSAAGAFLSSFPLQVAGSLGLATDCKGALYAAELSEAKALVERFGEPGTPFCEPAPLKPSNGFGFGKLKLNRKRGTATLAVIVPGPGQLSLSGKGLRRARGAAAAAGAVRLQVRLAGRAKRRLLARGKARVRAAVTFTPNGGDALTQARALVLKKALRSPARRR